MGSSLDMKAGDPCLTLGYPARRRRDGQLEPRPLSVQRTEIVTPPGQTVSIWIASAGERMSGESGGGLFDAQGRVVGVGESVARDQTDHVRVEVIRRQWESLSRQQRIEVVNDDP
jgi:hypothetical protein